MFYIVPLVVVEEGVYIKQAQKWVQVDALEILCNTLQYSVTLNKRLKEGCNQQDDKNDEKG